MQLLQSLRYGLYVIFRPFDGFWDLKNEKRGSLQAAFVIFALWLAINALSYPFTGFVVQVIHWEYFNLWYALLNMIVPFVLWCVSNWCFTSLMDGKGSFKDIFIASCYALIPFVLINPALIIISNIITVNEASLYWLFSSLAMLWFVFLLIVAMMQTHDYTTGKTILSSLLTVVGMGIIIFLFLVFFSLVSDGIAYFIALYKETVFRMY